MSNNNGLDLQQQILASLGFAVKLEWLDDMLPQLEAAHAGAFQQMSRDQQIQLILEQLLMADLRMAGAGGHLPAGVKDLHKQNLQGKYMLQLDEAVNIAAGFRERYRDQGPHRCLKLHLTDGVQDLVAMEYRFISALAVLMPAGLKLLIVNPEVRRGMLLLQPENVVVLGGVVDHLEAARQALLQHVNKPADHCAQQRTSEQIYQQAAQAAWANAGQQQQQQQAAQRMAGVSNAAGGGQTAAAAAAAQQPHQQQPHQQQQQQREQQPPPQQQWQQQQQQQQSQPPQQQQQQQWQPPRQQQAPVQQPLHQQYQQPRQQQGAANGMGISTTPTWQQQPGQHQQQQQQGSRSGLMLPPLHPPPRRTATATTNQTCQHQSAGPDGVSNSRMQQPLDAEPGPAPSATAVEDADLDPADDYGYVDDLDYIMEDVQPAESVQTAPDNAEGPSGDVQQQRDAGPAHNSMDVAGTQQQQQQHHQQQQRQASYPGDGAAAADNADGHGEDDSDSDDVVEIIASQHDVAEEPAGARQQRQHLNPQRQLLLQQQQQQQWEQWEHDAGDEAGNLCDDDFDTDLDRALDKQLDKLHSVQRHNKSSRGQAHDDGLGALQDINTQQEQEQPQHMDWHEAGQPQQQQQQPVLRRRHKRAAQMLLDSDEEEDVNEPAGLDDEHPWQQQQQGEQGLRTPSTGIAAVSRLTAAQLEHATADMKPPPNRLAAAAAVVTEPAGGLKHSAAADGTMAAGHGSGGGLGLGSRRGLSVSQRKRDIHMSQQQSQQQQQEAQQQQQQLVEPWKPQRPQRPSLLAQATSAVHLQQQQHQQQQASEEQCYDTPSTVPSPLTNPNSAGDVQQPIAKPAAVGPVAAIAAIPAGVTAAAAAALAGAKCSSGGQGSRGQGSAASGSSGGARRVSGGTLNPLVFEKSDPLRGRRTSAPTAAAAGIAVTSEISCGAAAAAAVITGVAAVQQHSKPSSSKPAMDQLFDNLLQALDCGDDSDLGLPAPSAYAGMAAPAAAAPAAAAAPSQLAGIAGGVSKTNSSSRVVDAATAAEAAATLSGARKGAGSGGARKLNGSSGVGSGSSKSGAGSGGSKRAGTDIRGLFARANEFAAAGALPLRHNGSVDRAKQQQLGSMLGSKRPAGAAGIGVIVLDDENEDVGQQLEQLDDDDW